MTRDQQRLAEACRRRGIGDRVCERIMRLNPNPGDGSRIRGYHPTNGRYLKYIEQLIGKGEFIRKHGRAAWDALPNGMLWKFGRRRYVRRTDYLDNIWKVWAGLMPPCQQVAWFTTKRYANDNDLEIEYISGEEFLRRRAAA